MLVSYVLDKSLFPRSLGLVLSELGIEFPVCLSIDLRVYRSPISFPLISIIESAFRQSQNSCNRRRKRLLEALIRVRGSGRADDVGRGGFTNAKIHKLCNGGRVEYITSVNECLGARLGELLEA